MPSPRNNETRRNFMNRCIPQVIQEGTASNAQQAVVDMWRGKGLTVLHCAEGEF